MLTVLLSEYRPKTFLHSAFSSSNDSLASAKTLIRCCFRRILTTVPQSDWNSPTGQDFLTPEG